MTGSPQGGPVFLLLVLSAAGGGYMVWVILSPPSAPAR